LLSLDFFGWIALWTFAPHLKQSQRRSESRGLSFIEGLGPLNQADTFGFCFFYQLGVKDQAQAFNQQRQKYTEHMQGPFDASHQVNSVHFWNKALRTKAGFESELPIEYKTYCKIESL
jgi:hypothetical protein